MANSNKQLIIEKIKSMPDLPSPSESALKIIRLAENDSLSLAELENAVRADPAFSARLLRIANSGRKRLGGRPIMAIKDALAALGLPAVRGLALGFSLLNSHRVGRCKPFDFNAFWLHSLALAQAFQTVSLSLKPPPRDEVFCVGLLANIGQLALACVMPEPYGKLLDNSKQDHATQLAEKERSALGMDHWQLSAELLTDWGIPEAYTTSVATHRQPYLDVAQTGNRALHLSYALSLAADIADIIIYPSHRTPEKMTELYRHGARISLDEEDLIDIGNTVAQEWQEWVQLLGLHNHPDMNFSWVAEAYSDAHLLTKAVTSDATGLTILIISDDNDPLSPLSTTLTNAGYRVISVDNEKQALKICLSKMPDIIITDWLMPSMAGKLLVRQIREKTNVLQPYVLALMPPDEEKGLAEALSGGADDYLVEPINSVVLLARMKAGERILLLQREASRLYTEMRDVTSELSASNRRLQTLATTDELTGFPNRRYAMERLQQEWSAALRHGTPLSCLVMDVDSLKDVSDVLGHERGDEALKEISALLRNTTRADDIVCRIGGDEFWFICPNTNAAVAENCVERLKDVIASYGNSPLGKPYTISIGIAERSSAMPNPVNLIEAAHRALLDAKHAATAGTS